MSLNSNLRDENNGISFDLPPEPRARTFFGMDLGDLSQVVNPWRLGLIAAVVISASTIFWLFVGSLPVGIILAILVSAVAIVMSIGLFAFSNENEGALSSGLNLKIIVQSLSEPACIASLDGRVLSANLSWTDAGGSHRRLPQGEEGAALFVAIKEASSKGMGRTLVRLGSFDFEMVVSLLGKDLALIRAASQGVLGTGLLLDHEIKSTSDLDSDIEGFENNEATIKPNALVANSLHGVNSLSVNGMSAFNDYAVSAPFGQAWLSGSNLFEAKIEAVNPSLQQLLGYQILGDEQTNILGRAFGDLMMSASRQEVSERLQLNAKGPFDIRLAADKDRPIQLFVTQNNDGFMVYLFDVSEQKQLEQSLAQIQKMQAIGQFAGGVAHDLNNLLTGLKLRVDELLHNHPLGDPSYDGLNETRQISTRAEDLVKKLLAFSRKQTVMRVTLNLGELVSEFEVLLRRLMREDVLLETQYGRDLPNIHADKGQMEMAVMNLVVNARDALHSQGGGKVKIRTAALSQAQAIELGWLDAPAQGAALIEVSDNGPGIAPEIMSKVFEPFFTTKPLGEGTGLGLATVYGVVNQSDGHISVSSVMMPNADHGASFKIFLPIRLEVAKTQEELEQAKLAPIIAVITPKDISGTGKILFVEDEDIVRGIAARLLRQRGYEVLEACDGEDALDIIEAENGKFDLVISDVIMPGLDGPSMLKRARPMIGNIPVMFISGYAEAEFSDLLSTGENISFLAKPLDIKTLAERVKAQLAA